MTVTVTKLTARTITNLYLYGQTERPSSLLSAKLIRTPDNEVSKIFHGAKVMVNQQDFMTHGGGRFVNGVHFELVNKFFTVDPKIFKLGTNYSKTEMAKLLGMEGYFGASINQRNYRDSTDDYAERTWIYGSTEFKLADNVRFSVGSDGKLSIRNFAIEVREADKNDLYQSQENFDFVGRDNAIMNNAVRPAVDPSGIGRTVRIDFTPLPASTRVYGKNDFIQDAKNKKDWEVSGELNIIKLGLDGKNLLNNLWDSGVTKTLGSNDRPILYGTVGNDVIKGKPINVNSWDQVDVSFVKSIVHFKDKGLIILSGAGDDIVTGSAFDDEIRGGTGADEIYGKVGNDVLYGELGADELYGNDGNDRLITSSSSAKDMEGDYIDGGAGIDTVSYDHLSTIGIQAQQNFDGSVSVYALNGENLGSEPIEYVFT